MPTEQHQQRAALARCVISLCEPLLATSRRLVIDEQFDQVLHANPRLVSTWTAGYASSILGTLPRDDPWRNLSATFIPHDGSPLHAKAKNVPLPAVTGARTKGRLFGARTDVIDMTVPEFHDWTLDIGLAAVAFDPHPYTSAIIGFASHGFEAALALTATMVAQGVSGQTIYPDPDKEMREILLDTLRRVIHRRRTYTGPSDAFPCSSGMEWVMRAVQWDIDPKRVLNDLAGEEEMNALSEGDYRQFSFH